MLRRCAKNLKLDRILEASTLPAKLILRINDMPRVQCYLIESEIYD